MIGARAQSALNRAMALARSGAVQIAATLMAERGRWALWMPVALGAGAALYLELPFVVPQWSLLVIASCAGLGLVWRPAPFVTVLSAAMFLIVGGALLGDLRVRSVAAPMISSEVGPSWITGRVLRIELNEDGARRMTVAPHGIEDLGAQELPAKVRLTVRTSGGEELQPGDGIRIRGVLLPPSGPAMPGAFDFARRAYFQRLGAVGYAISAPEEIDISPGGIAAQLTTTIGNWRFDLAARIRNALPGSRGGIAAALLTGDRSGIADDDIVAMRGAGLAHLLAISGLHMMLVGGLLFLAARTLLALHERWALTKPIKKWAAVFALSGSFFYLLLSGGAISTQRAFVMIAIVFLAILVDRPALTLRNVAIAALIVMLLAPEAVLQVSFQMSFAAVIALIAMSEHFGPKFAEWRGGVFGTWPGRVAAYGGGMALSSLIAGMTIAPFAAYHFNRFSNFEVFANLIAMPLMGFWVMPWGILAVLLMPLGLEQLALVPMGWGIDGILWAAHGVSSWPGAVSAARAAPAWALPVIALGGLWLAIWQRQWRWGGLGLIAVGLLAFRMGALPDLIVDAEGDALALRGTDGTLALMNPRRAQFEQEIWLRRDGDARDLGDARGEFACDGVGCVGHLASGEIVTYATHERGLIDDCQSADILVTAMPVLIACAGPRLVIDYYALRDGGAHALYRRQGEWHLRIAEDGRRGRPWSEAARRPNEQSD